MSRITNQKLTSENLSVYDAAMLTILMSRQVQFQQLEDESQEYANDKKDKIIVRVVKQLSNQNIAFSIAED